MTIEGFHVSRYEYAPGQIIEIGPDRITHFHSALEQANNVAAEDRLKPYRPEGVACRTNCIYAFDNLANCSIYGSSQHPNEKVHYYRVLMEAAAAVPMVLVDQIRAQLDPTDEQIKQMAQEYWEPTKLWKFIEYLTDAIEVSEVVQPVDMGSFEAMGAQCSFANDIELAKEFCQFVMNGDS
jgi:hypothetical protein